MTTAPPRSGRRTMRIVWAFALFVIFLAWLAPLQRFLYERSEASADAIEQNRNRAIMLDQYATRTLETANLATLHMAERWQHENDLAGTPTRPAMIDDPVARHRNFLGFRIADANGDLIATTSLPAPAENIASSEAFRAHLGARHRGLYVGRPRFSPRFDRPVLWLSRRVDDAQGRFAGVVLVVLAPEQLIGLSEGVSVGASDIISLIGLDGFVRARRTGLSFSTGEDVRGSLVMERQNAEPNGSYVGPGVIDGLVRYFSHRRLEEYPLFATYGVPRATIMAPVWRRARLFAVVATLITAMTIGFALILTRLLQRRDRSVREIDEARRRLEEAQQVARLGDWSYDLATERVSWSPHMFAMYERDSGEGAPSRAEFQAFLDPQSRHVVAEALEHGIRTGTPRSYEFTVNLPSGRKSHRLVHAIPRFDPDGKLSGLFGTDQDVTERKKLDQLEAAVAHLSRVEAMNAMASTLAHEINQPLTAASNFLVGTGRLLESDKADPGRAAEGIKAASEQVRFAGDILRRVRAMVANEPKRLSPVPVAIMIDDAVSLAALSDEGGVIEVERSIAVDARQVVADKIQIEQVLLNLLRNSRESIGARRGRIRISSLRHDERQVTISVEDDGSGFESADDSRFSAFDTNKPGGLGLGLSISRTIVEAHGGRIWLEDRNGSGAKVSFTIPAAPKQEPDDWEGGA